MLGLILVAMSLGLSNFAVAIGIGLKGISRNIRIQTGIIFGLFEGIMPVIGLVLGEKLAVLIGNTGRYIGAILLISVGLYLLWSTGKIKGKEKKEPKSTKLHHLVLTAFAISIDNLVVGFALSFYKFPLLITGATIAAVSLGMSLVGLELGGKLGVKLEKWSEELSGAILILVGFALAFGFI